jgi:outer membrane lipoprotein-sorting protein
MRFILTFISFLLLSPCFLYGQSDQEALKILDRFSSNALKAPSVSMKFIAVTSDQIENTTDTTAGSILLSKDKYKLEMSDNTVWFNGETAWNYLHAEEEVTITKADKLDKSFQNRPSAIFTIYKEGYKSRLIEEKTESYIIDLYPEEIKSELLRIRLTIEKKLMNLLSLEYKRRDGIVITLYFSEYNLSKKVEPSAFVFRPAEHKGIEVIDMR